MANAYIRPGVTVEELITPSLSPIIGEQTSLCIIGPAQGFENRTEVVLLDDNHPVTLGAQFPNVETVEIRDAADITTDPFTIDTDYVLDTSLLTTSGFVTVARAMQTSIEDSEETVVYHENATIGDYTEDTFTEFLTLAKTTPVIVANRNVDTDETTLRVMSEGTLPDDDTEYTVTGEATPTVQLAWVNTANILGEYQVVYIDYTVAGDDFTDAPFQLNSTTTVALPANSDDIVVKTAPGDHPDAPVLFTAGTTTFDRQGEDGDYVQIGDDTDLTIARSTGTTTMGVAADRLQVRITYQATPADYWLPTRVFSQADAEDKYGSAFDINGDISSAVSFACLLAFQNGASNIVIQALFKEGVPRTSSDGSVTDWDDTLESLRNIDSINLIQLLPNAGGLVHNDDQVLSIFQSARRHIEYMQTQDQYIDAILGEDGTGIYGSPATIQSHGETLGSSQAAQAESMSLITPGSFTYSNPITGGNLNIGGQFVAAAVAGQLAGRSIAQTLTRKSVFGINGVNVQRSEREKDEDASSGLLVVESKNGVIRVRHAVTTATANPTSLTAQRELSVVRSKHFVIESVRDTIDTQLIGNIVADNRSAFTVQAVVTGVLEQMVGDGVIVSYAPNAVLVRTVPNNPTALELQFSYVPAFPINNINVKFSLDTSSGAIISEVNTQGV